MELRATPVQVWLSGRVRLLCGAVFLLSLFIRPYHAESTSAPPSVDGDPRGFLLAEEGFLMKTSSLTEQGTRSAFSQGVIHTVEPGESLASIARNSLVNIDTIRWANSLGVNSQVQPGQKLLILPVDGVVHTVKRGQSLSVIAELYRIDIEEIKAQNNLHGGYLLADQQLIIPGGKPIVEFNPSVAVNIPSVSTKPPVTQKPPVNTAELQISPTYGIFQMPCDCFYTQHYGRGHYGIDLQHRGGSPIFAAEAGTVIRSDYGWNGGYGNVVEVDHGNGIVTVYAHNKENYVTVGQVVSRGEAIAFMGNTGRVYGPTGVHVHFEVQVNGVKKNPSPYLQQ